MEIKMGHLEKPKLLLKKYFGFDSFRPAQEKVIKSILNGNDTLAIMPTGAGKSVCFQVPALMFDGLTVVISPLISLMKDQVDSLNTEGIPATFLNGALSRAEIAERIDAIIAGKYKLLYIAPERMSSYDIGRIRQNRKISMIVVDEAHCISHWGHDFRPHYADICRFVDMFSPRPVVAAFTATATPKVREDIVSLLKLQNPAVHISGFDRPNLFFKVLRNIRKNDFILDYTKKHIGYSGIIYASTQKEVEKVHLFLMQNGIKAARYHAGLSDVERNRAQDDFIFDRADVIVATLAFGMGIDKSNIRYVIHYNMPKSVEGYYQEAGRAGRDGEKSECILLYSPQDVEIQKFIITAASDDYEVDPERVAVNMGLLQKMVNYCHTPGCLRHYLLSYFNDEENETNCGNCGNCLEDAEERDITTEAQMILSCVYRIKEKTGVTYGASITADVLAGSKNVRVRNLGFQTLSTYGLMKGKSVKSIRELINTLMAMGYLGATKSEYPALFLTDKAAKMLKEKEKVICRMKIETKTQKESAKTTREDYVETSETEELFEKLRSIRKEIADKKHKPAFMIFSDATLRFIASKKPQTLTEFREIQGVGEKKLAEFGEIFLRAINE